MVSAREVLSDFMQRGHLTYKDGMCRASDYERADALIADLAREGLAIVPHGPLLQALAEIDLKNSECPAARNNLRDPCQKCGATRSDACRPVAIAEIRVVEAVRRLFFGPRS